MKFYNILYICFIFYDIGFFEQVKWPPGKCTLVDLLLNSPPLITFLE